MADMNNLTGLEKPLTKLVETLGRGAGEVGNALFKFDEKKLRRIGRAEADAERIKIVTRAKAEAEARGIMSRAERRQQLESYNHQVNIENIVARASEYLQHKQVDSEPVHPDWTMRFLDVAQGVSDEVLQEVLARILAEEVARPATHSKRTLEVLRNVSKEELLAFGKFAVFADTRGSICMKDGSRMGFFAEFGLDFDAYVELCDAGLMSNVLLGRYFTEPKKDISMQFPSKRLVVNTRGIEGIAITTIDLTIAGRQIAQLLQDRFEIPKNYGDYMELIANHLRLQGAHVTVSDDNPIVPTPER